MGETTELRHVSVADVKARARALGFDFCGVAPTESFRELRFLEAWLERGYAGEMDYLRRSADRRDDVRHVLPSARSVIVLGTIYNVARPYSSEIADATTARLARYAWGDDYHVVVQRRMNSLVEWMHAVAGDGLETRSYVDTGPVQERVYAQYAGVGWIGKNTCVINAEHGSWIFLSEIICNLPLVPDAPALDQCGTCALCLEACPTGALVEPYVLDSRRCLSYLTIEIKGPIPQDMRDRLGTHAYGCDICQEVCPWNLASQTAVSTDHAWLPRKGLDGVDLLDLWRKSDEELRALLKGSAMERAGVKRLRRNLATAIGNSGDPGAADQLRNCTEPTCQDPLVREHVEWAIRKLDEKGARAC